MFWDLDLPPSSGVIGLAYYDFFIIHTFVSSGYNTDLYDWVDALLSGIWGFPVSNK
jgi:hypothetical protein